MTETKTIDVRFINPFVNATVNVMRTMAQTAVSRKEVSLKKNHRMVGSISGVIGIMGSGLEGTVALSFSKELAGTIVARMIGANPEELPEADLHDGLGELVNMISGSAKTELSAEAGLQLNLALPTVVSGEGHEITHRQGTPCLVIIFETEGKSFGLEVAFKIG